MPGHQGGSVLRVNPGSVLSVNQKLYATSNKIDSTVDIPPVLSIINLTFSAFFPVS